MGGLLVLPSGRSVYSLEAGSGPVLLCLHGLGGAAYFFSGLAVTLKDAFRTVAIDLPGCGFSPAGNSGFSFEDCVDIVDELVREKTGGPVAILGHSMGAIVALKLAARRTASVSRLIFVGGLPKPIPETQKRLRERASQARAQGMAGVADATMRVVFSPASLELMPERVGMYHRLLELNDPARYAQAAEALSEGDATAAIPGIEVPCLAITGSEDRYAPPWAVKEFVRQLPGDTRYCEMEGCGHMPFFEKPEVFERAVRDFLETRVPPAP